ncbi:uncharacterized protein [Littorina saxatilis]|uniref:uncharacterized protein n=1 Tax=Littorina saxatilis TaxID=31220 RepID=UPI0038B5146E
MCILTYQTTTEEEAADTEEEAADTEEEAADTEVTEVTKVQTTTEEDRAADTEVTEVQDEEVTGKDLEEEVTVKEVTIKDLDVDLEVHTWVAVTADVTHHTAGTNVTAVHIARVHAQTSRPFSPSHETSGT